MAALIFLLRDSEGRVGSSPEGKVRVGWQLSYRGSEGRVAALIMCLDISKLSYRQKLVGIIIYRLSYPNI